MGIEYFEVIAKKNSTRTPVNTKTSRKTSGRWDEKATQLLRDEYVKFDRTVDDIAADKNLASDFARKFAQKSGLSTNVETVFRKLINLRKKGSKNGGLPTIRH